jgi:hypothetical protein
LLSYVHDCPTFFVDPFGLEPKVVIAIGKAIAAGEYELAIALIRDGLGRNPKVLTSCLAKIADKLPLASQKCDRVRDLMIECFQRTGCEPVGIRIIGSRGERFFFWGKECFSKTGEHFATLCNGRIFDAITGPGGMTIAEYIKLWQEKCGFTPIIINQAVQKIIGVQ